MKTSQKLYAVALAFSLSFAASSADCAEATAGQKFTIDTKNYSVIVLRDSEGAMWPAWYYGRAPEGGEFVLDAQAPKVAFTMPMDDMSLSSGDQSKRIIGELVSEGKGPAIALKVTGMDPLVTAEGEPHKKGKKGGPVQRAPFKGELVIGGKTVPVQGDMTVSLDTDKKSSTVSRVTLKLEFTIAGSDIGLKRNAGKQVKVSATIFGKPAA